MGYSKNKFGVYVNFTLLCGMKGCLHCKKEFEAKKETAKFCSTSCRVMWNRKNGNKTKDAIQPFQMQVLYNSMMDLIDKTIEKFGEIPEFEIPVGLQPSKKNGIHNTTSHTAGQKLGIEKTFQQYMNEIADLEYEQEFKDKASEIQSATNLSQKQKDLLLINMRTSKL